MSPLPPLLNPIRTMWRTAARRDLGTTPPPNTAAPYTDHEQYNLQVLAVTFSSISVSSAILAFYWFRRMRRSFRHDLIMFLIQSDMFKALWFMIYPIVVFTHGPVQSSSSFCKVNGFFIALGIEASDFAVLMIAVHSALYIFNANPRTAAGEGGLYPYRRIAFVLWVVFPLLMASLAFINGDRSYVSAGTYCYLPIRPFWYRIALSWVPRYIIFITIFIIYASIYLFVRFRFKDFGRSTPDGAGSEETTTQNSPQGFLKRHNLPATPPLAYNGLLPESRQGSMTDSERAQLTKKLSEATAGEARHSIGQRTSIGNQVNRPIWTKMQDQYGSHDTARTTLARNILHPTSIDIPTEAGLTPPIGSTPPSRSTTWSNFASRFHRKSSSPRQQSAFSFLGFLRSQPQHPDSSTYASTPISQLELVNSHGQNMAASEVQRTREKIRRQLRFMFIYPLVYITMWILPFASHVLQYNDTYALSPPYLLSAIVVVIINSQCAVDCWLFSTRETPWRHIPGTSGGFFESLKFWEASWGLPASVKARSTERRGPGKSRAEMVAEARRAYSRRDDELAARRVELEGIRDATRGPVAMPERSWWDHGNAGVGGAPLGGDGAMSPVAEEATPLDFPGDGSETGVLKLEGAVMGGPDGTVAGK